MNDTEYLILPDFSISGNLCLQARSIKLNANCAVRICIPEEVRTTILGTLMQMEHDMIVAHKNNKLIKTETTCNPCYVTTGETVCRVCGNDVCCEKGN